MFRQYSGSLRLVVFLLINICVVLFFNENITDIASYSPDNSLHNIYFVKTKFLQFYLIAPLTIISSIILILSPGMLLLACTREIIHSGELILKGFALSFIIIFIVTTITKIWFGNILYYKNFLYIIIFIIFSCLLLYIRIRKQIGYSTNVISSSSYRLLYFLPIIAYLVIVLFFPVLFWQDLNADGFEAFEIGRSLSSSIFPEFPNATGTLGLGIGMLPMAYPVHWFIMLYGPVEVAARIPLVLYTIVLFSGLIAWIEYQSPRKLYTYELIAVVVGIATYLVAMSFNSGYDPYFSDIAAPTAFETLTVTLMLGAGYFLWKKDLFWFLIFSLLGFLARPTVLLFVLLLAIALIFSTPRSDWKARLGFIALSIGCWIVMLIGYEYFYLASAAKSDTGYTSSSIIKRFQYLRFYDFHRFYYAFVPGGILTFFALLAFRKQDPSARYVAIACIGYFIVFYFPAFTSLHHFVPVMVLPMLVLWRVVLLHIPNRYPAIITIVTSLFALWISLPKHLEINRVFRGIGEQLSYRIGNYGGEHDDHRKAIDGIPLLSGLFYFDWDVKDPSRELVGGYQLLYYARRSTFVPGMNYVIQPNDFDKPEGYGLLEKNTLGSIYVRDKALWYSTRFSPPTTNYRSRFLAIPRETLFPYVGIPAGAYNINLGTMPLIWRLFR